MCMEDIKIGRNTESQLKHVTATTASGSMLAPANNNRTSLLISSDGVNIVFLSTDQAALVGTVGIPLTIQNPVIELTLANVGSQLFQAWFGRGRTADTVCTVVDNSLFARTSNQLTRG